MRELPHTHSCFVCGESNPAGIQLRMHTDGLVVRANWTPESRHVGFKGTIHGGIISTILDEMMVWVCAVQTRRFDYCAELNVRFLRPVGVGDALTLTAMLSVNRKNRIFEATSELRNAQNEMLATGWGKYMPVKKEAVREMVDDVIGDLSALIDL